MNGCGSIVKRTNKELSNGSRNDEIGCLRFDANVGKVMTTQGYSTFVAREKSGHSKPRCFTSGLGNSKDGRTVRRKCACS